MAATPVRIERQADGRHAVMQGDQLMGLHNSVWSAARQMHDYFGSDSAAALGDERAPVGSSPVTPGAPPEPKAVGTRRRKAGTSGEHPPVPRPAPDHPGRHYPKRDTKRIPRP